MTPRKKRTSTASSAADELPPLPPDPPYSSGGLFASTRQKGSVSKYQQHGSKVEYPEFLGDTRDQRSWTRWMANWLQVCLARSEPSAYLFTFTDWRQMPATDGRSPVGRLDLAGHERLGQGRRLPGPALRLFPPPGRVRRLGHQRPRPRENRAVATLASSSPPHPATRSTSPRNRSK